MSGKVIRAMFIIFFFMMVTVQIIPNNVTAIGEPEVSLEFGEGGNAQEASVGPGDHNPAKFQCSVSVQDTIGSGVQGVYIELESSSEQGWESGVAPNLFHLYPGSSADFAVSVIAPFGTSSEIEDTVTISGYAEYSPGGSKTEITPIYGTIKIRPYYEFTLRPITEHIMTSPGSVEKFVLSIENIGNAINSFSIELESHDELEELGYEFELSDSTIVIPEKENRTIEVSVIIPEYLMRLDEFKGYNIKIKILSKEQIHDERNTRTWGLYLGVSQDNIFLSYEFVISIIIIIAIVISGIVLWRFKKRKRNKKYKS